MHFDKMPDDRKSEPQSHMTSRDGTISLPKEVEHVRQKLRADALTRVPHDEANLPVLALQGNRDLPIARSELDRVGEKIPYHLLQPIGITRDQASFLIDQWD
jgi:hypothetical protein